MPLLHSQDFCVVMTIAPPRSLLRQMGNNSSHVNTLIYSKQNYKLDLNWAIFLCARRNRMRTTRDLKIDPQHATGVNFSGQTIPHCLLRAQLMRAKVFFPHGFLHNHLALQWQD